MLSQQKEQKANMHKKAGERKAEYLLHKANLHNNQSINLDIFQKKLEYTKNSNLYI